MATVRRIDKDITASRYKSVCPIRMMKELNFLRKKISIGQSHMPNFAGVNGDQHLPRKPRFSVVLAVGSHVDMTTVAPDHQPWLPWYRLDELVRNERRKHTKKHIHPKGIHPHALNVCSSTDWLRRKHHLGRKQQARKTSTARHKDAILVVNINFHLLLPGNAKFLLPGLLLS